MNKADLIFKELKFSPTPGQHSAVQAMVRYLEDPDNRGVFILRGYAGTGKTSLISALVRSLGAFRMKSVLLAPTGRAAKVVSSYSKKQAFTIHRKIYRTDSTDPDSFFSLQPNPHRDTLFVVDEASMIGEAKADTKGFSMNLLEDLLTYVQQGENCRLLICGDPAQLPPVGDTRSPALEPEYIRVRYGLPVIMMELKDVVRQELDSGVLLNATQLRVNLAEENYGWPSLITKGYNDLIRVQGGELQDLLEQSYRQYGKEDTIIICRSNKRANIFNQQIRNRIFWREDEISSGDRLMVVKNNYSVLPSGSKTGFIANGDMAEIVRIRKTHEMYGLRFADVTLKFSDYPEEDEIDTRIMLDTLYAESPALPPEKQQRLYEEVMLDYADVASKGERYRRMKEDPWLNALQVKFAYAVTCHKAQGGQWASVFIEQGYLTEDMLGRDFLRWLYTGFTRTTDKLFLVGFSQEFFQD